MNNLGLNLCHLVDDLTLVYYLFFSVVSAVFADIVIDLWGFAVRTWDDRTAVR